MQTKTFSVLLDTALNSVKDTTMRKTYIAIIVNRGKILAIGQNKHRTQRFSSKYSVHAEVDALNKCNRKHLKGAVMYIIQFGSDTDVKRAIPCHDCQLKLEKCIKKYGLNKVCFTVV